MGVPLRAHHACRVCTNADIETYERRWERVGGEGGAWTFWTRRAAQILGWDIGPQATNSYGDIDSDTESFGWCASGNFSRSVYRLTLFPSSSILQLMPWTASQNLCPCWIRETRSTISFRDENLYSQSNAVVSRENVDFDSCIPMELKSFRLIFLLLYAFMISSIIQYRWKDNGGASIGKDLRKEIFLTHVRRRSKKIWLGIIDWRSEI